MRAWRAASLSVCLLVLAANVRYLLLDRRPPTWDDAWYLENSFRIFFALRQGLVPAASAYVNAFLIKAPLISLVPLPLYALFGATERMGLWANQLLLAAAWAGTYRLARDLYDERAGWAAAAACALMPLGYALSRHFLVETLLTALVIWGFVAVLEARRGDHGAAGRGALLGFGLLAKSIYPLYLAGPAFLERRALRGGLKRTLAIGLGVAATWYAFNAVYVFGFGFSAGFGKVARDYGRGDWAALARYAESIGRDAFSWPYLAAAAALCGLAWRRGGARWTHAERFLACAAAVPMAVFALGINKEIRYVAPVLPVVAVGLGAVCAYLARSRSGAAAVALAALAPLAVLSSQSLGVPAAAPLAYNGTPSSDGGWDRAAVVDMARRDGGSLVAVGIEHPLLNANNLASLAASRGWTDLRWTNLAQPSAEAAMIRLKDKSADRLLLVDGAPQDELVPFLNRANEGLKRAVADGRLPAREEAAVAVAPGVTARLYKLERP